MFYSKKQQSKTERIGKICQNNEAPRQKNNIDKINRIKTILKMEWIKKKYNSEGEF